MGEWILRGKSRESERSANRLFQLAGIAQGADESMVGLSAVGIGRHCRAEALNSLSRPAGGELVKAVLREGFCRD